MPAINVLFHFYIIFSPIPHTYLSFDKVLCDKKRFFDVKKTENTNIELLRADLQRFIFSGGLGQKSKNNTIMSIYERFFLFNYKFFSKNLRICINANKIYALSTIQRYISTSVI